MFEQFLTNQNSWLNGSGPEAGIVFSSRIRLARNFSTLPFPVRATRAHKDTILKQFGDAAQKVRPLKRCMMVRMDDLGEVDRHFLLERHLVSQDLLATVEGKALLVSSDERIAIMINEEDHLRMQVITSGFDLQKCWEILNEIDDELSKSIPFAFSPLMGYLTACPTNAGTALRASCMLHLPALVLAKKINKILELLAKISFTTRGLFGEGTASYGDFFQVSNQVSLGLCEQELIDNLSGVVNQIKDQEMDARTVLMKKYRHSLEDNIWRAFATLRYSRLISSKEAFTHLSMLCLGLDLGIIKSTKQAGKSLGRELVNSLFILIQPAHLQKVEDKPLKEGERDYIRAAILREKVSKIK